LELICAIALTSVAIVPALRLLRDAMEQSNVLETQELLTTLSVSKLEEQLALVQATWSSGAVTGDFAADGYASVRYTVVRSDQPADGGMVDRLMAVTATVWEDADGDTALDAGERSIVLATKVCKMARYL
jgi:hypothetical protein